MIAWCRIFTAGADPCGPELGEHVVPGEELARLLHPVLAEHGLDRVDSRAFHPHADIAPVIAIFAVAEPAVDDAMAGDERGAPVNHHDLAMVPLIDDADVGERTRMEEYEPAARFVQSPLRVPAHFLAPGRIDEHTHRHACPGAFAQRRRHAFAELAFLPEKRLEVHRALRGGDVVEQRVEERPVLDDLHAVARYGRAERESRQRSNELLERAVRLDLEVGVAVSRDRPYDEEEKQDDRDQQDENDARHFHGERSDIRERIVEAVHRAGGFQRKRHARNSIEPAAPARRPRTEKSRESSLSARRDERFHRPKEPARETY
jgi:hypothetical protein